MHIFSYIHLFIHVYIITVRSNQVTLAPDPLLANGGGSGGSPGGLGIPPPFPAGARPKSVSSSPPGLHGYGLQ
jgi:hypothetical protein